MSHDAIQLQQIVEVAGEPSARRQASYLSRALAMAWTLVAPRSVGVQDEQPDGLEAFDLLGGWNGTDVGRGR